MPPAGGAEEAQSQFAADALGGLGGESNCLFDRAVRGCEVLLELVSQISEDHPPGRSAEQGSADAPFGFLDELRDAGWRNSQPRGRAAEVQLLAQGQERLDFLALHRRSLLCRSIPLNDS